MPATVQQQLIWSPVGKPVSVHVNPAVFRRMRLRTTPDSARAIESGGLLVGYAREIGERWLIAVEDAVEVSARNPLLESWSPDRDALESALVKWSPKKRGDLPHSIGWYRTHSRPGLFLDEADFRLFRDYFPPPANISMVVGSSTGGFFFWEDGDVRRFRPYDPFPVPAVAEEPVAAATRLAGVGRPKPAWLAVPVVAGVALGLMWNPDPLKRRTPEVQITEIPDADPGGARAVFAPPPEEVAAAAPAQPSGVPPASAEPMTSRARSAAPVKQSPQNVERRLAPIPKPRITAAEPVMDFEAPQVAAVSKVDRPLIPQREEPIVRTELEPSKPSAVRRVVGSIPGLGFLKRRKPAGETERYTPPKVVREIRPTSPAGLAEEVGVRVRVMLNAEGKIEKTELLTRKVQPAVAKAAVEAAQRWRFEPARVDERPVASELVVQFRFPAAGGGS